MKLNSAAHLHSARAREISVQRDARLYSPGIVACNPHTSTQLTINQRWWTEMTAGWFMSGAWHYRNHWCKRLRARLWAEPVISSTLCRLTVNVY